MITGNFLENITFSDDKPIAIDSEFWQINRDHRLYWKDDGETLEFVLIEWIGGDYDDPTWKDVSAQRVIQYSAKYAGEQKRHMWCGEDNDDGYLHLPGLDVMAAALKRMEEMFQERLKSISQ
ncbi:hypothetical protein SM033_00210 [Vibrio phage vB_VpaM_sm033]|nr:hypothetical protein SM033_00210 [Vibrio phage vB_VpaM_sm033]